MQPAFYQRRLRPYNGFNGKFFVRLLMLIAAVLLGNAVWKFGERQLARYESVRLTSEAESLLGQGRKIEAQLKLRSALGYDPRNIQANRLTARLLDQQGDPRALEFYRFVVLDDTILPGEVLEMGANFSGGGEFFTEGGDYSADGDRFLMDGPGIQLGPNATFEDAEALARAGVSYGNHRVAREVAITVGKTWGKPEFPHLINAAILERSGDFLAAEKEFRTAATSAETPETLNALANFLLERNDAISGRTAEAATLLERAASLEKGPNAIAALRKILSHRLASPERLPDLISKFRELAAGDVNELQSADLIELEYFPGHREKILEGVVDRSSGASLPVRIGHARWLLKQNDPARAARVLPLKDALADKQAFETAIETLFALQAWIEAEAALALPANPLEPHRTAALRAMAAARSGNPRATQMWTDLFEQQSENPETVLFLLQQAAACGRWDLVFERLPSQFNDPSWAMRTFEKILPLARSHGDPAVLIKIHALALNTRMLGGDPVLRNRAAFDRLVAGAAVSEDELAERASNFPENPSMRVTLALGFLRHGAKTRALYELEEVDPGQLAPPERAAFAVVLAVNGRIHEAGRIASSIPPGSLTVQESAFLDEHLKATADLN